MKRRIYAVAVLLSLIFSIVQYYPKTANAEEVPVLSDVDARNLICFLYDKNLTIEELKDDPYYSLITGKFNNSSDLEAMKLAFSIFVETKLNEATQETQYRCDIAYGKLIEYFEQQLPGTSSMAEDVYNQVLNELTDSMLNVFKSCIISQLSISFDYRVSDLQDFADDIDMIKSSVKTIKGIRGKAQSIVNSAITAINGFFLLINQEKAGRYKYFSSYLAMRESLSPDDPAFKFAMDTQCMLLADQYPAGFFDWFIGEKKPWYHYRDDIDKWAEYVYNLIGDYEISSDPYPEPGITPPPVPTATPYSKINKLTQNTCISGDYTWSADTLDLNGYRLIVTGKLTQTGGTINISNGFLAAYGGLELKKGTINNDEYGVISVNGIDTDYGTKINGGHISISGNADLSGTLSAEVNAYGNIYGGGDHRAYAGRCL